MFINLILDDSIFFIQINIITFIFNFISNKYKRIFYSRSLFMTICLLFLVKLITNYINCFVYK